MVITVQEAAVVCRQELGDCRHRTSASEAHWRAQEQDGGVLHFPPMILRTLVGGQNSTSSAPRLTSRVPDETGLWEDKIWVQCSGRAVGHPETGFCLPILG